MCNKLILLSVTALAAVVGITHAQYSPYGGGYSLGGYGGGGGSGFIGIIVCIVVIILIARLRDGDDDDYMYMGSGYGRNGHGGGDISIENQVYAVADAGYYD